jgi:hypothetical protein
MFEGITPQIAVAQLKTMLQLVGVEDAHDYITHDIRRGHAKDLQLSGRGLAFVLAARSNASLARQARHCGKSCKQGSGGVRPS